MTRFASLALLLLTALIVAVPTAGAAPARPDLAVKTVTAPSQAAAGGRISVSVDVRNAARRKAPSTALAFALSRDRRLDRGDVKLGVATRIRALRARGRQRPTVTLAIPAATKPGRYLLLACADPDAKVRERNERNNCKASVRAIAIVKRGPATRQGPLPGQGSGPAGFAQQVADAASGAAGGSGGSTPGKQDPKPGPEPEPGPKHPDFDPDAGSGAGPDPAEKAPPVTSRTATSLADAMKFLYEGENAIQKDVEDGAISDRRLVVVRGRAITRADQPLAGVKVEVLDHPELGHVVTQADGGFDIAVNGGGLVKLTFSKDGYIDAQREVDAPWKEIVDLGEDVALVKFDKVATDVDLDAATPYQVHQAAPSNDADGTRQSTLLFEQGTDATMELPSGQEVPLDTISVRATEYTVGGAGDEAMPGDLPATSGYTYAVEMSVDEAVDAGATDVKFTKPVVNYTENFLGFPAGEPVPTGYFDREKGEWIPSKDGRVIKVLDESADTDADGAAEAAVDTDGDGLADEGLGIDVDERERLAQLYDAGESLWRVEMTHFTPWDHNWPYGPPENAVHPRHVRPNPERKQPKPKKDCYGVGSIIGCQSQRLGEMLPVAGSRTSLAYWSDRVPGRGEERSLAIPLTGSELPDSLRKVRLVTTVAGRTETQDFAPQPNMTHNFAWDGKDAYGRRLQGHHPVTVKVGYVYGAVYYPSQADFATSFGRSGRRLDAGGGSIGRDRARQEVVLWNEWRDEVTGSVGLWDARAAGLGGWTFANHHFYDAVRRTVHLGDGSKLSTDPTIATIAGASGVNEDPVPHGDGGQATDARLRALEDVVEAPDGTLYVTEAYASVGKSYIRRIAPDGTISTYAGGGDDTGEGVHASQARMDPQNLALLDDGDLLFTDPQRHKVRRIDSETKLVTTFAGNGGGYDMGDLVAGDGGPATQARIPFPKDVAVGKDGSVYIPDDHNRLRRVLPDGTMETYAGGGTTKPTVDGIPARSARLYHLYDIEVGPDDTVYVNYDAGGGGDGGTKIAALGPDGIIKLIAGGYTAGPPKGDGNPALETQFAEINGMAIAADGSLLVHEMHTKKIRRIDTEGILSTFAGGGPVTPGNGDGGPAPGAHIYDSADLHAAIDGSILVVERHGRRIRRIGRSFPRSADGVVTVPSRDGSELFQFDADGKHVATRDALTEALLVRFEYDGEGRLSKLIDGDGLETTVVRDNGRAVAIVAPGGQRTELTIGDSGYLERVENPDDEAYVLAYKGTDTGLLTGLTEPEGGKHTYVHDGAGRLLSDTDPETGVQTLSREEFDDGYATKITTSLGRTRRFEVRRLGDGTIRLETTERDGSKTTVLERLDGSQKTTAPSGMVTETKRGPDPRWQFAVPVLGEQVDKSPSGKTRTTTFKRTVDLADPRDPLSLESLTDTLTVNGKAQTTVYDAATRTLTRTSAGGRVSKTVLDSKGRVTKSEPHGVAAIDYVHDSRGRLQKVTQGSRSWTYTYDGRDRVETRTDGLSHVTRYGYDDADRITSITNAQDKVTRFEYDDDGNRTAIVMPDGKRHELGYTKRDQLSSFKPFGSSSPLSRVYDKDGRIDKQVLPGGAEVDTRYDAQQRPNATAYPEAVSGVGFKAGTSLPSSLTRAATTGGLTDAIGLDYDGELPTKTTVSPAGSLVATFDHTYGNDLLMSSAKLTSGVTTVTSAIGRDDDGLATTYGPFTLQRQGPGGSVSSIADTKLSTAIGYDDQGVPDSRQTTVNGAHKFGVSTTFDDGGRPATRVEKIGAEERTFTYVYDATGRLKEVKRDGTVVEAYGYDDNGNRVSRKVGDGPVETATYDAQQRLQQRGDVAYEFSASGHMTKRGQDTFTYSARGELLSATVGPTTVEYRYDGLGRRVARVQGNDTTRYLYGNPSDPFEVTGVRSPSGTVTRYFYDEQGLLFAMQRGASRFYIATDQVGTPRAVTDVNGNVVKRLELDAFGAPVSDTAPAFDLPFGFAGGLTDSVTGLVRFGLRDYDPAAGRWTARDPALFEGGQTNLYAYVNNEPVARRDPTGMFCIGGSVYGGFGGGASFCIDDEGFSVCVEAGLGVGTDIDVDFTGDVAETGTAVVAEAKLNAGPAGFKLGVELDDQGCLSGGPEVEVFGVKANKDGLGLKKGIDAEVVGLPNALAKAAKAGLVAKVAAKFCQAAKF